MASLNRRHEETLRKLDSFGLTVVNYRDPVDGSEVPCLEIQQVAALLEACETAVGKVIEAQPFTVKVETEPAVRNLIELAVQAERETHRLHREALEKVRAIYRKLADDPTFDGYTVPFDIETELGEALNPITGPDGEAI